MTLKKITKDDWFHIGQVFLFILVLVAMFSGSTQSKWAAFAIFVLLAFRELAYKIDKILEKLHEIRKDQIENKYDTKTNGFYIRQIDSKRFSV